MCRYPYRYRYRYRYRGETKMIFFANTQIGMPLVHMPSGELCYLKGYNGNSKRGGVMYIAAGAKGDILDTGDAFVSNTSYIIDKEIAMGERGEEE